MKKVLHRAISALGTLLVLSGIALLAYVGITYARSLSSSTSTPTPVATSKLSGQQKVAVPVVTPAATSNGDGPGIRMIIPEIDVDSPVVQTQPIQGTWDVADWAVGHLATTPDPGVAGNGAYAAHDDIKGEIFKRLPEVVPGNRILLYSRHRVFTYVVTRTLTVDPSNVSVLATTAKPTITLITCVPYWVDTQRFVVQATLVSSSSR